MNNMIFLNLPEAQKKMAEISINKIVFWIGAGVDSGSPTCLPLGNGLTDYILEQACGKYSKILIDMWESNAEFVNRISNGDIRIANRPRLETVIEIVREFEKHQKEKYSVINGLRAFSAFYLKINPEHYTLAYLLHQGANIVTTNYGDFICKAYEDIYGRNTIKHESEELHIYKTNNKFSGCIYHIHGISDDIETIGANLSNIKKSLPQSFKETYRFWIENNYSIVYIGYSGLDSLDVNPFLCSVSSKNSATGLYIRHSENNNILPATDKEKMLLQPFNNKFICPCIASEFLHTLIGKNDRKKNDDINLIWQEKFKEMSSVYPEHHSEALILNVCYRLGLNISLIFQPDDWRKLTSKCSNMDDWYNLYQPFQNAVTLNDKEMIEKYYGEHARKTDDKLAKMDYFMAIGKTVESIGICETPQRLLEMTRASILSKEVINWDISTPLNRHIEIFLYEALECPTKTEKILNNKKTKKDLSVLINCFDMIIKEGYDCVEEVTQINTSYRGLGLCQILNGVDIDTAVYNINVALINYADISSISGIVLTSVHLAIVYTIDSLRNINIESLKKAKLSLHIAYEIINKYGLLRYEKRYNIVNNFYLYVKSITKQQP